MFSLFENVYSKNVGLINVCQMLNDEVVHTTSQITKNLYDSDESQKELKKLNDDYQNILSVATERRDNLIESKGQIQEYKDQISDLKKSLNSTHSTPYSNKKLISDLNGEIKSLKLECQHNLKEANMLTMEIRENSDSIDNFKKVIKTYCAEEENAINLVNDYDNEKIELHKMNEEIKKEIEEVESQNIEIEEKQREEQEKLELQREKINYDDFSKILTDFHRKISILQEEKDDKLQTISKKSKQLKKIKSENSNKIGNRSKVLDEIKNRDEQLESIQQTINSLENDRNAFFPKYREMVKKYKTLEDTKFDLREKYKKLQEDRFFLNLEFAKNENDRLLKVRKVQQETNDNEMQISYVQRESQKTEEILRQAADTNNDMTNIKRGIFDDKKYVKTINDEIDDKQAQRKFFLSNYLVEKAIIDSNKQKIELLNEQIIKARKEGDQQVQMMQVAKHEKETFAKKMETVQKEHDQLYTQYHEITNLVDTLTNKIETIVNQTIKDHFLKSEYNTAISYINKMKKRTEKGIKITKKVIFNLISEQQTLKKIIDQTVLDQLSQKKQIQILKTSQDRIVTQISQKVKEMDEKNSEVLSLDQLLRKGHEDYNQIMKRIGQLNGEFEHYLKQSKLLESKAERTKELKENKKILENNLMIEKCKATALFQESKIKMHCHRWTDLTAVDNGHLMQIKFHQRLKSKLIEKTEELQKLKDERDSLIEKVNERKKYVERFYKKKVDDIIEDEEYEEVETETETETEISIDDDNFFITKQSKTKTDILFDEIEKARNQLKEKNKQILEMKKLIESQSHMIIENRQSVSDIKKLVNDRKSIVCQLKSEINEIHSKLRASNRNEPNEPKETNDQVIQQIEEIKMKSIITVRGGGFKPKPPKNESFNCPRSSRRRVKRKESPSDEQDDTLVRKPKNSNNGRPFKRKINKNIVDIGLDDENDEEYVVKKRNGRVFRMKKQAGNENEDDEEAANSRYDYNATKGRVNFYYYYKNLGKSGDADSNMLPQPPLNAQLSMRPNVRELRKKLSRNVAVPETPNSRLQEKRKKKTFKKKKSS